MLTHMKLKIGVMGSATGALAEETLSLAFVLGQAIGLADCDQEIVVKINSKKFTREKGHNPRHVLSDLERHFSKSGRPRHMMTRLDMQR